MENIDFNESSNEYKKADAYLRAQKRLKAIKGFYWHAFWYVMVNIFIFVMIVLKSDGNFWHFGTFSTPLFWGIGLGFHALSVFGKNLFFGKKWEARKIDEYMNKDKKRWE
ncbi:2TM domain-containing protein [Flavivirga jejuensis]|uniref:2TM domain-containing protein n=1 Tax=Flavivirga jejuensis TaxID=870487 RepID=A0ABT8WTR9_9FLAO|nr:2TM domain-containing protein [Flavivirga jejuensis]MDO5976582.1 2TM domain-containing protein [Flavivirga jejuensis]